MRSSIIIAFAALALITPASAQQVDQNTRQQIERVAAAYVENWNKHDAAGLAALYTKDGVQVTAAGVKSGPQEIEQAYQSAMKTFPQHNGQTIEQISPLGNDADIRIGEFHLSGQGQSGPTKLDGRYTAVDVREGRTWKIRLLTAVPIAPPAPLPSATAGSRQEARQVANSVVNSFMAAYNTHDPKAISALFLPDAMLLGFDGTVTQGREAIERVYAGLLKNQGGHFTVVIKDANSLGDNVVVANDELEIRDVGQNHDTIHGRAVITLAKTPDGWRYAAISAQKLPPPGATTGSRQ